MKKIFRDGRVHVRKMMCRTCIFHRGNRMSLSPGRVEEMVEQATKAESSIVCHETLGAAQAVCSGFFTRHATMPLQVADRLGFIDYD